MTRARQTATWSNVLWSSLRTMTRQSPPWPVPGPSTRGRSIVCGMPSVNTHSVAARPVPVKPQVQLIGRRGLDRLGHDVALCALLQPCPVLGDPCVLVELLHARRPLVEPRAHAVELRTDV